MRSIPSHITDPETIKRLNQIDQAYESAASRHRLLAKKLQSSHYSQQEVEEWQKLSGIVNALEKAWKELTPSLMEIAIQKQKTKAHV